MRLYHVAAFALAITVPPAFPVAAQETAPGVAVERVTLEPGQSRTFTLAPGFDHQLLRPASPNAAGAITVRYEVTGGQSTITATSKAGHPLTFTVLADPDGNGGFDSAGSMTVAGDGTPASKTWPRPLGTINVGDFAQGPHGDHQHRPSGS